MKINFFDNSFEEISSTPVILAGTEREFIKNNPDITCFEVKHEENGKPTAIWTKTTCKNPGVFSFGQYTADGDFVFIDDTGWQHRVYSDRPKHIPYFGIRFR